MKDYKKIFEGIVDIIRTTEKSDIGFANICTYIGENCPELKESEDEKIRKWCISHFKACINVIKDNDEYKEYLSNKVISWLEKQGRHANFRNKIQIGDKVTRNEDGVLVNLSQLNRVAKKNENQGEQKPQGKTALEAINEEKVDNANKVEPKFKQGDWIVCNKDNTIHQVKAVIENISNGKYVYDLTRGGYISSQDANFYHLWTLRDAKGGDVLSNDNHILILKELVYDWSSNGTPYSVKAYCGIKPDGNFEICKDNWCFCGTLHIHPATKEQCNTLKKAMADAGYTFDFERKELKKIKDETEIPYGSKDSELQEDTYYIPKGFHAEIDGDKVVIKKGEKPTAWSEEDEKSLDALITSLNNERFYKHLKTLKGVDVNVVIDWLKSLKDRVGCESNCTATKEWGEEDKTALGDALWCCKQAASIAKNENDMGNIWYAEKWLKSLEGRIHPKNDYNQYKEVVESIAKMCERYDKYSHSILKDFFNNVKAKCKDAKEFDSLHPQNTKAISQ